MTADRFPPTPGLAETAARVGRAYDAAENRDVARRARKRMEAAAPDMLAALKDAQAEIRAWRKWAKPGDGPVKPCVTSFVLDKIAAAIAKAEGAA